MKLHDKLPSTAWTPLLGLFAAAALVGCAAGPDYREPAAPQASAYVRGEVVDTQAPPPARWWVAYGSERLNGLVERALQRNPGMAAAEANLRQAQENVNAQRGLFYPSLQLGYNVSRQNSGAVLSSSLNSGQSLYNLHTAQLNVGFVPDVFGGNRRQLESLQAS
ncbi:MAG: TolC family protein, partial [Roseateles sp.]